MALTHWQAMRAIFGDPDPGMPRSGNQEADAEYARGVNLLDAGDDVAAKAPLERADDLGHAGAPRELAYLAMAKGDTVAFYALMDRARERGDGRAASLLGHFRREDPDHGLDYLRFADESGDCEGSRELGLALEEIGDLKGAEEAFRRSDQRASPSGSLALGLFMRDKRGHMKAAETAFRRAEQRGHPKGALNLIDLYVDRDDAVAANQMRERALELAPLYPTLFEEMQGPDFARYVRHVKGNRPEAATAASGGGCVVAVLSVALATAAALGLLFRL